VYAIGVSEIPKPGELNVGHCKLAVRVVRIGGGAANVGDERW
jgi:hypothetical protein